MAFVRKNKAPLNMFQVALWTDVVRARHENEQSNLMEKDATQLNEINFQPTC